MPLRPAESAISRPSEPDAPPVALATMFVLAGTALLAAVRSGPANQFARRHLSGTWPDASD